MATAPATGDTVKRIQQRGLWFEEFEVGTIYAHRPGRTVTETDNVLFTTLTMNTQPLHLDQAASELLAPFHDRLVNSMFTLSTLVGLSVTQLTQGTIVANLGFSEISFPAPVRHGDTLYAETLVEDKRPGGGDLRGELELSDRGHVYVVRRERSRCIVVVDYDARRAVADGDIETVHAVAYLDADRDEVAGSVPGVAFERPPRDQSFESGAVRLKRPVSIPDRGRHLHSGRVQRYRAGACVG